MKLNVANGITLARILLLPLLTRSYSNGNYRLSFVIISMMALSDYLDGKTARLQGTSSAFGARFDVAADCLFVFIFQGVLLFHHDWPIHIFLLSILSAFTFIAASFLKSTPKGRSIGRYSGGVVMLQLIFHVFLKVYTEFPVVLIESLIEASSLIILLGSIMENLLVLAKTIWSQREIV